MTIFCPSNSKWGYSAFQLFNKKIIENSRGLKVRKTVNVGTQRLASEWRCYLFMHAICTKLYNFIRFEVAKAVTEATWHSTCCILPQAAYNPLLPTLLKKKLEKKTVLPIFLQYRFLANLLKVYCRQFFSSLKKNFKRAKK